MSALAASVRKAGEPAKTLLESRPPWKQYQEVQTGVEELEPHPSATARSSTRVPTMEVLPPVSEVFSGCSAEELLDCLGGMPDQTVAGLLHHLKPWPSSPAMDSLPLPSEVFGNGVFEDDEVSPKSQGLEDADSTAPREALDAASVPAVAS